MLLVDSAEIAAAQKALSQEMLSLDKHVSSPQESLAPGAQPGPGSQHGPPLPSPAGNATTGFCLYFQTY